jgi:hypothetical protein
LFEKGLLLAEKGVFLKKEGESETLVPYGCCAKAASSKRAIFTGNKPFFEEKWLLWEK